MLTAIPSFIETLPTQNGSMLAIDNVPQSAYPLLLADLATQTNALALVLVETSQKAQDLANALHFYLGNDLHLDADEQADGASEIPIIHLPDWETLPYDSFSPHEEIISKRLKALTTLNQLKRGLLILPIQTLAHKLPPRRHLDGQRFKLKLGDQMDLIEERSRLESAGYHSVESVQEHGEFAVRGAIFDVFPMGVDRPIRIELFDNQIESLRVFNVETQRTITKIDSMTLLPAREIPMTELGISTFRKNWHETFEGNPRECSIYQDVSAGFAPPGIEYYAPLFFGEMASLFDYLPIRTTVVRIGPIDDSLNQFWSDVETRYESLRYDRFRPILAPEKLFFRTETLSSNIKQYPGVVLETFSETHRRIKTLPEVKFDLKETDPAFRLKALIKSGLSLLFVAESPGRREALLEHLGRYSIHPKQIDKFNSFEIGSRQIAIAVGLLDQGLIADQLAIIPENQLFGRKIPQRRRRKQYEIVTDLVLRDLSEMNIGDPVVHVDHGVGYYRGLEAISLDNEVNEFVIVEYQNAAKLYIPVSNLSALSRYAGGDPNKVVAHKLGTDRWNRIKQKAAEEIRDKAADLLDIYAKRAAKEGFAHQIDQIDYEKFANGFQFELTPDQNQAVEAVLSDLQSLQPMDRLICGDVGFGKTEVAMRAAFATVSAGRTVCVLVPTTLLAQQHFESLRDRFADWAVTIEVLSRFKTMKETKLITKKVNNGSVDILVGTHKLLSSDLNLPNLGLLIIDEEHRFGVSQKEAFKKLRSSIDILTLTATPIPRTLNLAMVGIRDLSIIATPPARRMSVKTFIKRKDNGLIKEAILRELLRGGQVYYIYNEVKSIERIANNLKQMVPEARVVIAHGQMRERELENVMSDFYHKKFNVLVCSTIIETGIDIPSANTILIERADRFGLAQLHQLRGRVGRSHHQAYAYLLTPDPSSMTEDAHKRLEAIKQASELGAGFHLATQDLEIRGAGELLGEDQSGNMQTIGFSLYMEMLDQAVSAIRENREPDYNLTESLLTEVDLKIPALIPESYLRDIPLRLEFYKRISSAPSNDSLSEIEIEMIDRFGLLPTQIKNLFQQTRIKLHAEQLGIQRISLGSQSGRIEFQEKTTVKPAVLINLVQSQSQYYKLVDAMTLKVVKETESAEERLTWIQEVLDTLEGDGF